MNFQWFPASPVDDGGYDPRGQYGSDDSQFPSPTYGHRARGRLPSTSDRLPEIFSGGMSRGTPATQTRTFTNGYADLGPDGRPESVTIDNRPHGRSSVSNPGQVDPYAQQAAILNAILASPYAKNLGASEWNDLRGAYQNAANRAGGPGWGKPQPASGGAESQLFAQSELDNQRFTNAAAALKPAYDAYRPGLGGMTAQQNAMRMGYVDGTNAAGFVKPFFSDRRLSGVPPERIPELYDNTFGKGRFQKDWLAEKLSARLGRNVDYNEVAKYGDPDKLQKEADALLTDLPKQYGGRTVLDLLQSIDPKTNMANLPAIPAENGIGVKTPAMSTYFAPQLQQSMRDALNTRYGLGSYPEPSAMDSVRARQEFLRRKDAATSAPATAAQSVPLSYGGASPSTAHNDMNPHTLSRDMSVLGLMGGRALDFAGDAFRGGLSGLQSADKAVMEYFGGNVDPHWLGNF